MNEVFRPRLLLCVFLMLIVSACVSTDPLARPVYGSDNRVEAMHGDTMVCEIGSSVVAIFSRDQFRQNPDGSWTLLHQQRLSDLGWCGNTRFAEQPATARCTGFLIAPDLVATAGHCIDGTNNPTPTGLGCDETLLVLDFKLLINGEVTTTFAEPQVFSCSESVAGRDSRLGPDWRVIRLDRTADRTPLSIYTGKPLSDSSEVHVVGHPLGLPMKAANEGRIRGHDNGRYRTTLDTFRGNSGSPVYALINDRPVVIGIMSGGEHDKAKPGSRHCDIERICGGADNCRGQLATDARSFASWTSHTISNIASTSPARSPALCAWCQEPLRSRFWHCPVSDTLE